MFTTKVYMVTKCPYCGHKTIYDRVNGVGTDSGTLSIICMECSKLLLKVETKVTKDKPVLKVGD